MTSLVNSIRKIFDGQKDDTEVSCEEQPQVSQCSLVKAEVLEDI